MNDHSEAGGGSLKENALREAVDGNWKRFIIPELTPDPDTRV
ncbi:MAG: hypothetical protein ACOY90_16955 [Candidatus Zhuqueibacterota bacterium]